ncbi:MAG TPA: hypothetical protein VMD30_03340 [Tepidisphaeraceae bacterium]|nr:hypothetical protein [Tepidisphaeraceae bacterium]
MNYLEFDSHDLQRLGCGVPEAVYVHERISPAGHHRLVIICTHCGWTSAQWDNSGGFKVGPDQRAVPLCFGVLTPLTFTPGSHTTMHSFIPPAVVIGLHDDWRLYAGQSDPANPSHLTIGYAINGQIGTFDIWLCNSEGLRFHIRDGPATTRPTEYFDR